MWQPSCQIPINQSHLNGVLITNLMSRGNRIHGSNHPDNVIQWQIANSNLLGEVLDKQVNPLVNQLIIYQLRWLAMISLLPLNQGLPLLQEAFDHGPRHIVWVQRMSNVIVKLCNQTCPLQPHLRLCRHFTCLDLS